MEKVLEFDFCVLGNHDEAVLTDPTHFNIAALRAILWTRKQLKDRRRWSKAAASGLEFLSELPRSRREGDLMFVHGSPCEPTNEYVFKDDVENRRKMGMLFDQVERYCFQGHTHMPGVFTRTKFLSPDECDFQYHLGDEKLMINVGSVGQPRDSDPRACYVLLTDDRITFRRVEYPVEETAEKIYAIYELDDALGDRLRVGR